MGPGIPRFNSISGGFVGGVRTRYHSFFPSKFSRTPTYDRDLDFESDDEYDNRPSSAYNKYYEQRPYYNGNVKFL
jgi:gamma-glutamyl:cysteine ligase YbdK (ATP-grasp superfamily)